MRWTMVVAAVVVVVIALVSVDAGAAPEQKVNIVTQSQKDWAVFQKLFPLVMGKEFPSFVLVEVEDGGGGFQLSAHCQAMSDLYVWVQRHKGHNFRKPTVAAYRDNGDLKVTVVKVDKQKTVACLAKVRIIAKKPNGDDAGKLYIRIDKRFPVFRIPLLDLKWEKGTELEIFFEDEKKPVDKIRLD